MILTQCAVCATELGLSLGKKCGRCSTRYCGPECQVQHWKEGGHDTLCKPIKKAGGAEQYNANKKYSEAVAAAATACAEDTKGQTCFICTQALHWKTKEGLVRGCACRGTAGFAHVSCLVEQAKILCAEAEENNLGNEVENERFERWHTCSLCERRYHGVVQCALGWACWKTYVGLPETDRLQKSAMSVLGNGLLASEHYEDALSVYESQLSMQRRLGSSAYSILITQSNLASTYGTLGRLVEASRIQRDVYSGRVKLNGEEHIETLGVGSNYASSLVVLKRFEEAKSVLRRTLPVAQRVLGESHGLTLRMRVIYTDALYRDPTTTLANVREAVKTLEEMERTARRVLGSAHPMLELIEYHLRQARTALRTREGVESIREGVEAMPPGAA